MTGRILPLPPCMHVFPILADDVTGPCERCGAVWMPTVLICLDCARRFTGPECPTPACQEKAAALVAEWIANGVFDS